MYSSGDTGHAILWVIDLGSLDFSVGDGFTPGRCFSQASGSPLSSASNLKALPFHHRVCLDLLLTKLNGTAETISTHRAETEGTSQSWKLAPAFGL